MEQASQGFPVSLRGVVAVRLSYGPSFFLLDKTGAIFVQNKINDPQLQPGIEVEVRGETVPGGFAPDVVARSVKVLGKGTLPPTRVFSSDELAGGKQACNWIAIRGVVHSAEIGTLWRGFGGQVLRLGVDSGSGDLVEVVVFDTASTSWERLPGATVRISGIAGTSYNKRRQFVNLRLYVAHQTDIVMERPALKDPFTLPLRPIISLMGFGGNSGATNQAKVRGIVTWDQPDEGIYIQGGKSGVLIRSRKIGALALGTELEAVGFPASGGYSPTLDDAVYRVLGQKPRITALQVAASEMIGRAPVGMPVAPYDSLLVQTQGRLLEVLGGHRQDQLVLQDGNTVFNALLPKSGAGQLPLAPGSFLSLTGILVVGIDSSHQPRSFEIRLRSVGDVVILKAVPWWNTARAGWAVAFGLIVILIVVVAVATYRHNSALRSLAMTDPLTGLYNRRGFFLLAQHQWQRALRRKETLLLLFMDVDRFKDINDTLGHEEGDNALKAMAGVLQKCFRDTDIISRMGGDEFAVLCDGGSDVASQVGLRLVELLDEFNTQKGSGFQLSLSVGVLVCNKSLSELNVEELVTRADTLMYQQKKGKKQEETSSQALR